MSNDNYQHVLLVTDLRADCDLVASRAKRILQSMPSAHLSVLHIVEETVLAAGYEIVPIIPLQNEEDAVKEAHVKLNNMLERNQLDAEKIHIDTALSTRRGILDYVKNNDVDLVIIGRHERTGFSALLGATADDLLPAVPCDVLVVKLGEPV